MKIIKIFLASSKELVNERDKIELLKDQLNKYIKPRGIQFEIERWEYENSGLREKAKQDEYNAVLIQCEICLTLFWRICGDFTVEEFNLAAERAKENKTPKIVYVYFKNIQDGDIMEEKLKEFKESIYSKYKHFHDDFDTVEALQLKFLLQLENYQKELMEEGIIHVNNGFVCIGQNQMIDFNKMSFTENNQDYQKLQEQLLTCNQDIKNKEKEISAKITELEKIKIQLVKIDEETKSTIINSYTTQILKFKEELLALTEKQDKLTEQIKEEQEHLFQVCRIIAEKQGKAISEQMQQAIDAFNQGDIRKADSLLTTAESNSNIVINNLLQAQKNAHKSIEVLLFKATVRMANVSYSIDNRIEDACKIYEKAATLARMSNYDPKMFYKLLAAYEKHLRIHTRNRDKDLSIAKEMLKIAEENYGKTSMHVASCYNLIGINYLNRKKYDKAFDHISSSLKIRLGRKGECSLAVAQSYLNLGIIYEKKKDYDYERALAYYNKSLEIREKLSESESIPLARIFNKLIGIYIKLNKLEKAQDYILKCSKILEQKKDDQKLIVDFYKSWGAFYENKKSYMQAIEKYQLGLEKCKMELGLYNNSTLSIYKKLAEICELTDDRPQASIYNHELMEIYVHLSNNDDNAASCFLGKTYLEGKIVEKDLEKAIYYYQKASNNKYKAAYGQLAWALHLAKRAEEGLPWALKANEAFHDSINNLKRLAVIYEDLGLYDKALEKWKYRMQIEKKKNNNQQESIQKILELESIMHEPDK